MGFTPMEAGARGAEGIVFVTGCPIRVLSGKGMNILCFPALARRPVAMQEAVSRNTSRNGYEGPTPWIHVTRTQLFLLISVIFALRHRQYVFVGLPSCKMKRFSGIFKFLHWKDGQALAPSGCLRKRGNHCLWMCS